MVNRVARARAIFEELRKCLDAESTDLILMIGPSRPVDRDVLTGTLEPIYTGSSRKLTKPFVLVATQCIEVGVDIDLDGLVTEAAPIDALLEPVLDDSTVTDGTLSRMRSLSVEGQTPEILFMARLPARLGNI